MRTLVVAILIVHGCAAWTSAAKQFEVFLPVEHFSKVSLESVHGVRSTVDDDQEDIAIVYYALGKKVATLKAEKTDLMADYNKARQVEDLGPFFGYVDRYVLRDAKGRCYLLHFEFDPGHRYRFAPLKPIGEKSGYFLLQGFMQTSSGKLCIEFDRLGKKAFNVPRREAMRERAEELRRESGN